ncbi:MULTISPECIES: FAD-dependent oxidoreductase [Trueperella]|uniref:Electron transfer flavoprotein-ubiquinone oxidoreductase n=1 Tax=Trueperella bernardiae TaxID=59561 RepID=A0A0W1KI69_9ACTO|nr:MULTISPECIES: FAD-dependent oxidoreductase [Trueperella]KTF03765.1 Electron transfer flavoprotein-ubiquinone oxidoreductase [Trueperella bernardiae]MCM3907425.1 FAD-dependent oxidoreductase [Trueperella bernardiae]MDK8601595.1 FAD-dependent oxidoreductase [Trueperella bernardiae]OFS76422.1 oxidoreductase [Trueperella sp. HMSC08B05]PKZ89645.1 FAD-dependent oxidoreductase [Trueperella bernardiae]
MAEVDFDVIVVGGGVAGSVCSYLLAKDGYEVLLIERGVEPGSKNLSGGVFYCRVMQEIFDNFLEEAPIERVITRNCLSFLNKDNFVNIDYWDGRLSEPVNAVTVLRAKFDPWLAEQCENVGVTVMPGVKVDELVRDGGQFVGVRAGEDELRAHVVVAADGVNSFLSQYAGIRAKEPKENLAVGVKSVIALDPEVIAERFNLTGDEGAAYAVVGDCTQGVAGGGFMYTNRDSISIGIVARLDDLEKSGKSSSDLHDHFLTHPAIAPFLKDGELLEYGCHLVAEGGKKMQHDLVHRGLLVIGDAAGFTLNTGFTVRGMDLAAGSARAAASVISDALKAKDFSAEALGKYVEEYNASFVGKDMDTYAKAPDFLENPAMYGDVGELVADVLHGVYNHDLTPRKPLLKVVMGAVKRSRLSLAGLAKLGISAVRSM